MTRFTGFQRAARRALATFVFATTGQLIGSRCSTWTSPRGSRSPRLGSAQLVNLAYRWAEPIVRRQPCRRQG